MSMKKLAAEFAAKKKQSGRAGNVYYQNGVIYSYGQHFPMAYIRGSRAFINSSRYSQSTSRQQSTVRCALRESGYEIKMMPTDELKELISQERAG